MIIKSCLFVILMLIAIIALSCSAFAEGMQIPSGVKTIEEEAFTGIAAQSVTIPESVETISSKAFKSCPSLHDVYLPYRRVDIAEDAFDVSGITFHVYLGSDNASWAANNGYDVAYISGTPTASSWSQVNDLISSESVSLTADNPYYTHRLIVKTKSGNNLPALDQYSPKAIVSINSNLFVLQFDNDTDASTCANALKTWGGCQYVEVDYFLSSSDSASASGNSTLRSRSVTSNGINASDPMGFGVYVDYLGDDVGNVTVAIIDTGVNASEVSCTVSSDSYDFINNRSNAVSGFTSHGTLVAQTLCNSFGSLATKHLTIISYRVENPANSNISYIQMGEAILQAKADGADFINISIAGESTYSTFQDNEFLRECINTFGSSRVIAAGGNSATSVENYIPAKYCTSVTGVKLENGELARASGTALYATYGGFASTTSVAAPKITAALALIKLDPDSTHTMSAALIEDHASRNGMPNLEKLAIKLVERITFADYSNNDTIILEVGDPLSIQYSVYPSNATVATVTPVSSNNSVLKYKSHTTTHARFTAEAAGTAEIIFTSDDGNAEARLTVQVIQPPTSVTITANKDTNDTIYKNESIALSASILPSNATNQTIIWTCSNNSVATIESISEDTKDCVIKQAGSGDVVITATAQANSEATASITLHCSNVSSPSSVVVTPAGGVNTIYKGKTTGTVQMIAQVLPSDADQTVEWFSSNPSVATVNINTGVVTAVGRGETIITARAVTGNASGFYNHITVIQLPTSITVSGTASVIAGNTTTLSASVLPDNANDKAVTWASSNTGIATVSSSGVVTGVSAGTALISATSVADNTVAGSCYVTVSSPTFTVTLNPNGGSCGTTSITATKGVKLGTLPTPTRDYYDFVGWFNTSATTGGTQVASETVYNSTSPVTIYARWTLKPEKGWVVDGNQPSGAQITKTSWSYRILAEDTATSMSGYTQYDSYWRQTGSGSKEYASFPSGYDTNNQYYKSLTNSSTAPYSASETTTTKREVNNPTTRTGFIYWHWMYSRAYDGNSSGTAPISSKKGNVKISSSGPTYYFGYFYAIKSTTDCAYLGTGYCCNQNIANYDCRTIIPSNADKSSTSGLGTYRFFRFPYYTSSYTDYEKVFKYYKDYSNVSSDPGTGSNITNKIKYVKYREK